MLRKHGFGLSSLYKTQIFGCGHPSCFSIWAVFGVWHSPKTWGTKQPMQRCENPEFRYVRSKCWQIFHSSPPLPIYRIAQWQNEPRELWSRRHRHHWARGEGTFLSGVLITNLRVEMRDSLEARKSWVSKSYQIILSGISIPRVFKSRRISNHSGATRRDRKHFQSRI